MSSTGLRSRASSSSRPFTSASTGWASLEHLGVVVGEEFDAFSRVHRAALTGQQFQSADVDPVYVLFEDFTHVKFYRRSFFDVVEDEVGGFDGFTHVDHWVPQRLVTATGPNPLPR